MSQLTEAIPPFIEAAESSRARRVARPSAREWTRHGALLVLTFITTTIAGIMLVSTVPAPNMQPPSGLIGSLLFLPQYYYSSVAALVIDAISTPSILWQGVAFAASLLLILAAHEAGHYVACRKYGVDATLPFFLPAPPLFLAGTFGAFIKIKSPIPSRRALFDIGLAGPLAGFVVALPIAVVGVLRLESASIPAGTAGIIFSDPLLIRLIARMTGADLTLALPNSFYMAA